jgi:DNA helicase-2/ATP-dependent DNA helicase PcrA
MILPIKPTPEALEALLAQRLTALRPTLAAPEKGHVDRVVRQFRLSATALNNYLDCPLRFYHQHILKVPSGRNEYSSFGTAIHAALEQLFRQLRQQNDRFSPVEDLIGWFEQSMEGLRSFFTPEQYANRLVYGRELLTGYYQKQVGQWNKIVSVERNLQALWQGRIPLTGKVDKLEFDGQRVTVVDYKTGRYDRAKAELQLPNPAKPLGGNYWRQAVFYKLLVQAGGSPDWQMRTVQFDFVEPVKPGDYRRWQLTVSPEQEDVVAAQMEEVWARVQAHDFYTGCGRAGCAYCELALSS